jgi:hypothetical protein
MAKNTNLNDANKAKNDEFYTQLSSIEKELRHYKDFFKNKTVFCNCDDPETSNFWKFFELNFEHLGFKKLIATHFEIDKPSYKLELTTDITGDGKIDKADIVRTPLIQNGDFRSPECIEILKEADVVVSNPPFSLFREYVAQLVEYNKDFIIIGNQNAITYKDIFKLIKENKIWLGHTSPKEFLQPDGSIKTFGNISWFTNVDTQKRHEDLILYKTYYGNENEYKKYDNYDAINIDKTKDIPMDYFSTIGVPITFLDKFSPDQFEILGITDRQNTSGLRTKKYTTDDSTKFNDLNARGVIKTPEGYKAIYARLLIKNKKVLKNENRT